MVVRIHFRAFAERRLPQLANPFHSQRFQHAKLNAFHLVLISVREALETGTSSPGGLECTLVPGTQVRS